MGWGGWVGDIYIDINIHIDIDIDIDIPIIVNMNTENHTIRFLLSIICY